jgi:hypothetical protein
LRSLAVASRDAYGFMEWVEHRPCTNDGELKCFYFNAGRTMALEAQPIGSPSAGTQERLEAMAEEILRTSGTRLWD